MSWRCLAAIRGARLTCREGKLPSRRPARTPVLLPHSLNKCNLVDLLQRGHSQPDFIERRFAQESHALFSCCTPDLRRWLLRQNHFADPVAQIQQFVDRGSSAESCARALDTARTFIERYF